MINHGYQQFIVTPTFGTYLKCIAAMNPTTPYYQPQQSLYAIWVFATILLDNFTIVFGGDIRLVSNFPGSYTEVSIPLADHNDDRLSNPAACDVDRIRLSPNPRATQAHHHVYLNVIPKIYALRSLVMLIPVAGSSLSP
ncbi:uncharacterized protein P174DRAFT_436034 [Aspergillus novofumigatus IBT 16806]|uniref:Uncharacterized protein n=1 Tax=Aspergillus novofumigatus (strain IBT 16806) TaxID=1392255 RepID=A0A2I1BTA0_ASPN1|nr:uncharacterized protein P174DRAFT_436034 [Aspergillus novofumigatus IBT 16806]PKX88521.1 hypothetical protein P174DRAFT_436034 [Aspergillus novofumigatus IBT 16806]